MQASNSVHYGTMTLVGEEDKKAAWELEVTLCGNGITFGGYAFAVL